MLSLLPFSSLFLSTLGLSTVMALSSNNWIIMWASMELNLLSMIPLITLAPNNQETEAAMKYFFAQAIGSATFLASVILISSPKMLILLSPSIPPAMFLMSILLKTGAAPCHFWLPNVMSSLSWLMCLILTTWQKIIPLWLIIHLPIHMSSGTIMFIGILGALIGGLGGMNQTQLRPLLAYSSINHTGWMITCSAISINLSLTYFLIYIMSLIPIMITFSLLLMKSVPQANALSMISPSTKTWIMSLFLSLGGLPPLIGFMPKLLALTGLLKSNLILISLLLILGSLLSLYYYLTVFFNSSLSSNTNTALLFKPLTSGAPYMVILLSALVLMPTLISLMYALIIFY